MKRVHILLHSIVITVCYTTIIEARISPRQRSSIEILIKKIDTEAISPEEARQEAQILTKNLTGDELQIEIVQDLLKIANAKGIPHILGPAVASIPTLTSLQEGGLLEKEAPLIIFDDPSTMKKQSFSSRRRRGSSAAQEKQNQKKYARMYKIIISRVFRLETNNQTIDNVTQPPIEDVVVDSTLLKLEKVVDELAQNIIERWNDPRHTRDAQEDTKSLVSILGMDTINMLAKRSDTIESWIPLIKQHQERLPGY
jgi:hypothetical protein